MGKFCNVEVALIFVLCHIANDFVTSLTLEKLNFSKNLNMVRKGIAKIFCSFMSRLQNVPIHFPKRRLNSQSSLVETLTLDVDVLF